MAIVTKAGFWSDAYAYAVGRSPKLRQLARLRAPLAARKDAELLIENIGVAVGQTASVTVKQVDHLEAPGAPATPPSAATAVETRTVVSRATLAADETSQEALLATKLSRPSTYAADRSGNGGGSKIQAS